MASFEGQFCETSFKPDQNQHQFVSNQNLPIQMAITENNHIRLQVGIAYGNPGYVSIFEVLIYTYKLFVYNFRNK